jgi:hypothetical protein
MSVFDVKANEPAAGWILRGIGMIRMADSAAALLVAVPPARIIAIVIAIAAETK